MPRVSVIIPTYNRAHCIERALKSVQSQTLQDYEVLVCDDASSDETRSLVGAMAAADSRIQLLCLSKNSGAGAARNLGMQAAVGEYIALLDSDDEWFPEKLGLQVEVMDAQPPEVGVCFCGGVIIKNGNTARPVQYMPRKSWEHETFRKFVLHDIPFLTPTVMFRRACLKTSGLMTPEMRRQEDAEFLLRLFASYGLVVVPGVYARVHLEVRRTAGHYEALNAAVPYHLRHDDMIRRRLGRWPELRGRCAHLMNVLCAAIEEQRWPEARRWAWRRMLAFPILMPSDAKRLMTACLARWMR
jgi:glycosyltransferase involved in cell wall biosynthesis